MNESKKCGPGSTKALHHIIRNTAFTRRQHRLTVFYTEQWLYEPFGTFETNDEQLVHYERYSRN